MQNTKPSRNNPVSGGLYFLRGLGLITRKGIKRFVAIPLLINTLVFAGGFYLAWGQLDVIKAQMEGWLPSWLDWLSWLLWPLFIVAAALVVFFGFAVLANLIAAPFNGMLAEKVEQILGGGAPQQVGGVSRLMKDLVKSLYSELRKLLYFVLWAIPLLVITIIPVVNVAAPFLWLAFGAWMLAVEYADFPMGNHGLTFPVQRKTLARKRMLSLGFGGTATLFLMVPGVNFLVIPAAVAGATAMWVEQLKEA